MDVLDILELTFSKLCGLRLQLKECMLGLKDVVLGLPFGALGLESPERVGEGFWCMFRTALEYRTCA